MSLILLYSKNLAEAFHMPLLIALFEKNVNLTQALLYKFYSNSRNQFNSNYLRDKNKTQRDRVSPDSRVRDVREMVRPRP